MTRLQRLGIAVVLCALVACGGGKGNNAATGSGAPDSASVSVGSAASDSSSSTLTNAGAAPGGDDSPVVGADQGGGGAEVPSSDAPVPPGLKPFPGVYRYHTTGTGALNGSSQPIDAQSQTTIEDLNDTDQRITTPSPQLTQISDMRFTPDQVALLSLKFQGPINKTFNGPVEYAPVPTSVGQSWQWSMKSDDGKTTLSQTSRVDRTETLTVGSQTIDVVVVETDLTLTSTLPTDLNGSGHLTTWVSPVYKLPARIHSTLNGTYSGFSFSSDTTSDLLDLRPG